MKQTIYNQLTERKRAGRKLFTVLIDPDKVDGTKIDQLVSLSVDAKVDYFFVGGSLITTTNLAQVVTTIKENVTIPVVLFPGNSMQIDPSADALLFLSLISGRNPELLIGQHVIAAPVSYTHLTLPTKRIV